VEEVIVTMDDYFQLDTAVGEQLTFLGQNAGWPRTHCNAIEVLSFGFQRPYAFTDITDDTNFTGTGITWDSVNGYWVPDTFSGAALETIVLDRIPSAQPFTVKISIIGNQSPGKELSELRFVTTAGTETVDLSGLTSITTERELTYNIGSDEFERIEIDYIPDDAGYFKVTQIAVIGDNDAEPACVDVNIGDFCVAGWPCGGVTGPTIEDYTFTDDELYRKFIKAKLIRNRSNGNIVDLIKAAEEIFGAGVVYIEANSGATVTLGITRALTEIEDSLEPLYSRALPIVRAVDLQFYIGPNTNKCT